MNRSRELQAVIIALLLTALPSITMAQNRETKIDEFIAAAHGNKLINGVVLVAEKGEVVYSKAIGLANMEWQIPHTLDSKFEIASVSKQFTCTLVLQLAEEGKIDIDGVINDYLPDYPDKQGSKITIRHLMTHSSGIPNFSNFENWYSDLWIKEYEPQEFIKIFNTLDLQFEPGSRFRYSNSGYYLLGLIVEKVAGKPFNQVVKERILVPLGMNNSGCIDINTIVPMMSSPYEYWQGRHTRSDYDSISHYKGTAFIYTTAMDMFIWHQAQIQNKLIAKETTDEMMSRQIGITSLVGYGFGLAVGQLDIDDKSVRYVGHEGAVPGFHTIYSWFPETDVFILLINNTGHTEHKYMRNELYKILAGKDVNFDTSKVR